MYKNSKLQEAAEILKIIRKARTSQWRWQVCDITVDVVVTEDTSLFWTKDTEIGLIILRNKFICVISSQMAHSSVTRLMAIERNVHAFLSPQLSMLLPSEKDKYARESLAYWRSEDASYLEYEIVPIFWRRD